MPKRAIPVPGGPRVAKNFRFPAEEVGAWEDQARLTHLSLTEWIRMACGKEVRRRKRRPAPPGEAVQPLRSKQVRLG